MDFSIANGWLEQARQCESPNFGERPSGSEIDLLVLHSISLPPGKYGGGEVERFFCNALDPAEHAYFATIAELRVSAHLFIDRQGEVVQFVDFDKRAWHAGRSSYQGREECNDFSIGIELEGTDTDTFEPAQYETLAAVCAALMRSYPALSADRIAGHSEVAPGRKFDPGVGFDWDEFRLLMSARLVMSERL